MFLFGTLFGVGIGYVISQITTLNAQKSDLLETEKRISRFWAESYISKRSFEVRNLLVLLDPDSLYFGDEELINDSTRDDIIDTIYISTTETFLDKEVIWVRFIWDSSSSHFVEDSIYQARPNNLKYKRKWKFR